MAPSRTLSAKHEAALRASGLSSAVIESRGYWTATSEHSDELPFLGFSTAIVKHGTALMIPEYDVRGEVSSVVARPDVPRIDTRGRPVKYQRPRGSKPTLDVPPLARPALADSSVTLWVTEGQKKADSIVSAGGYAIGVHGVWAWKGPALPAWDSVALKGRTVYVAFDSDAATNSKVTAALRRLRAFLGARGAHVRIVHLEAAIDGGKVGIDDALAAGATLEQLAATSTETLQVARPADDRRPELDVTTSDLQVSNLAFGHLARAGIYRTGQALVRVVSDDGVAVMRPLHTLDLRALLHRTVRCVRTGANGAMPCLPPRELAEDLAHAPEPPLPTLRAVATAPTFTRDGRLLERGGYDARSGLLLVLSWTPREVPTAPTAAHLEEARAWWDTEALVDFPFASEADHTAAIGVALTPVLREMIDGPVPLTGVEASVRGAGKGKLVTALLTPALGPRGWTVAALPREEEELRKALTAYLTERRAAIVFDNVCHAVRSAVLAKALTDTTWDDRLLGRSESVRAPVRCTWVLTANNPSYSDEIARRMVPIRLVPQTDRPELRRVFRHPELEPWIAAHRPDLLWSLAVFVRAWQSAGCPPGPVLGSYEAWSRVIGGVLQVAGYRDFLANREGILAEADPDTATWSAFLAGWWEERQGKLVSVLNLLPLAQAHGVWVNGDKDLAQTTSLGMALGSRRDRFFGPFQVCRGAGRARRQWFLKESVTPRDTYDTYYPRNLRVARVRAEESAGLSAGLEVAQVAGGVTDTPELRLDRAWDKVRDAEDRLERAAIENEGAA